MCRRRGARREWRHASAALCRPLDPAQLVAHVERGLEALTEALLQAAADHALEITRNIGAQAREWRRGVAQDRRAHVGRGGPREWPATGGEFVEKDSQREQVRARVHGIPA